MSIASAPSHTVVVAASLATNAAGRAQVLAQLAGGTGAAEIIAAHDPSSHVAIWPPLAQDPIPRRTFEASNIVELIVAAQTFAEGVSCDNVIVSKARLSAMLIGLLIVHRLGCPIVLDNDDWELGCTPGLEPLAVRHVEQEAPGRYDHLPNGRFWTRVAEALVPSFIHRTAASLALQSKFGGVLIRHARHPQHFRPRPEIRAAVRRRYRLDDDDVVVLFLGTPRRHKGLVDVAEAIAEIGDPKLRLVVIGDMTDQALAKTLAAAPGVTLHASQPLNLLSRLVQLADGVCLFQDQTSAVAQFQIPAKLTDALAMGVDVAASPTPALADVPADVLTRLSDRRDLERWLRQLRPHGTEPERSRRRREWFLQELSHAVNARRLDLVLTEARREGAVWSSDWTDLFKLFNRRYGTSLPETPPAWAS